MIGGLGNQLFQIFATAAYALKYNRRFVLPNYIYGQDIYYIEIFTKIYNL